MIRLRLPRAIFGGRQKYISLGIANTPRNRQLAQTKASQIEVDIILGSFDVTLEKYKIKYDIDIPQLNDLWQRYCQFKSKELAPSSKKAFVTVGNHLGKLPTQNVIEARRIANWLIENLSPEAARRTLMQVNACCNWAVEQELIEKNPFHNITRPKRKQTRHIHPFTAAERDLIIETFKSDEYYSYYHPFVCFLFLTGCRPSEAIALKWEHIDPQFRAITFCEAIVERHQKGIKTGKTRHFPINNPLSVLLKSLTPAESPRALLFPSPKGKPIDLHNFTTRAWKGVLGKLVIRYRPTNNTRHTFITLCLKAGVPVQQVAAWVGNSPKIIFDHYAGLLGIDVPEV
ncbi:site-specific integrase [Lusitaniella coriacea]|nr:site-specific integrase [Lusitaniella coriacea]